MNTHIMFLFGSLFGEHTSTILFLLGLALAITILLRRSYRYFGRRKRDSRTIASVAAPPKDDREPLIDAPPNILRWQVEMHETARDMKAELDTKMIALQQLIQQAREQTQRLESALDRAERLGVAPCRDTLAEIERVTAELSNEAAAAAGEGPLGDLPDVPEPPAQPPVSDRDRRAIYALADEGISSESIAEQVGATLGEVEMILSLRR